MIGIGMVPPGGPTACMFAKFSTHSLPAISEISTRSGLRRRNF